MSEDKFYRHKTNTQIGHGCPQDVGCLLDVWQLYQKAKLLLHLSPKRSKFLNGLSEAAFIAEIVVLIISTCCTFSHYQ